MHHMHTHRSWSYRWVLCPAARVVIVLIACHACIRVAAAQPASTEPATLPSAHLTQWLVTTHSGDDVILFSDTGRLLHELVVAKSGGLNGSRGLLVMPGGDLLVACSQNSKSAILRYHPDGTFVSVFATGGTLVHPYAMAFGPDHDLFVSGQDDDAVSRYDGTTGKFINTFVPPGTGGLKTVRDIIFDHEGDLLVASRDTNSILKYDGKTGKPLGEMVRAGEGGLSKPIQVLLGPDHRLYVGSSGNSSVIRYEEKTGKLVDVFVKPKDHGLDAPSGMAFDPTTGDFLVESRLGNQVLRYSAEGKFKGVFIDKANVDTPEYILPWTMP